MHERVRSRIHTVSPLFAAAVVAGCAGCVCRTDVEERVLSPNREFVAETVHTDCGALSEYATVVRVRRNHGLLDRLAIGNEDVLVVNNEMPVWLRWAGDATLVVRYRDHRGSVKRDPELPVTIVFETYGRPLILEGGPAGTATGVRR